MKGDVLYWPGAQTGTEACILLLAVLLRCASPSFVTVSPDLFILQAHKGQHSHATIRN